MKYLTFWLIGEKSTGNDELGNPITTEVTLGVGNGRFTEWSAEEIRINGIDYTAANRKLLTSASLTLLRTATSIKVENNIYEIIGIKKIGTRFNLVLLKGWRL